MQWEALAAEAGGGVHGGFVVFRHQDLAPAATSCCHYHRLYNPSCGEGACVLFQSSLTHLTYYFYDPLLLFMSNLSGYLFYFLVRTLFRCLTLAVSCVIGFEFIGLWNVLGEKCQPNHCPSL